MNQMSDPRDQALADIYAANGAADAEDDKALYLLLHSVAESLVAVVERLDNIDDALRNTIGGNPR